MYLSEYRTLSVLMNKCFNTIYTYIFLLRGKRLTEHSKNSKPAAKISSLLVSSIIGPTDCPIHHQPVCIIHITQVLKHIRPTPTYVFYLHTRHLFPLLFLTWCVSRSKRTESWTWSVGRGGYSAQSISILITN